MSYSVLQQPTTSSDMILPHILTTSGFSITSSTKFCKNFRQQKITQYLNSNGYVTINCQLKLCKLACCWCYFFMVIRCYCAKISILYFSLFFLFLYKKKRSSSKTNINKHCRLSLLVLTMAAQAPGNAIRWGAEHHIITILHSLSCLK